MSQIVDDMSQIVPRDKGKKKKSGGFQSMSKKKTLIEFFK